MRTPSSPLTELLLFWTLIIRQIVGELNFLGGRAPSYCVDQVVVDSEQIKAGFVVEIVGEQVEPKFAVLSSGERAFHLFDRFDLHRTVQEL